MAAGPLLDVAITPTPVSLAANDQLFRSPTWGEPVMTAAHARRRYQNALHT